MPAKSPAPRWVRRTTSSKPVRSAPGSSTCCARTVGEEPENAHLAIKSNPHDFGTYYEVVCHFDDDDEEAAKYAYRCESEAPSQWDDPPPTDQQPTRVCDSCIETAAEQGIPDYKSQAAIMVEIAADIEDHVCDTVESQAVR